MDSMIDVNLVNIREPSPIPRDQINGSIQLFTCVGGWHRFTNVHKVHIDRARHIPVSLISAEELRSRSCPRFPAHLVAPPRKKQRGPVLNGRAIADAICRLAGNSGGVV
jgi:hypothetical protein